MKFKMLRRATHKTVFFRAQIDEEVKAELEQVCDKRGMTQTTLMSRLVKWFVLQDATIQTSVLHSLSEPAMQSLARQRLRSLTRENGEPGGNRLFNSDTSAPNKR